MFLISICIQKHEVFEAEIRVITTYIKKCTIFPTPNMPQAS